MKLLSLQTILIFFLILSSCTMHKNYKVKDSLSPENISGSNDDKIKIVLNNDRVIIRDSWGVPHVYGKSDADAAFALAYAHAQDDFITIHDALLKARGKYASVYGKGNNNINAIFDYLVGLLKIWDIVNNKYDTDLDEETIKICEGYASGLNYFIENNSKIKQHIYPVTGKDIIAGTLHKVPFFFQLPLFLKDLFDKSPDEIPTTYTIGNAMDAINDTNIKGSNVYAISPNFTDNNNTLLAINSHQPFEGELAWYEAHVNSQEGWNMVGGLFPGAPIILVGHNDSLGWGHTVNKPDILDIYELEINPKNENQYKFDNQWYDFESYNVIIDIKTIGNLKIKHKEIAYWSIHGPVIKGEKATYAFRYSNMDDIKAIEQWYKMNKAKNFKEWKDAISMLSVPMFNTGYADNKGNIFYLYGAKIPIRNEDYNWQKVLPGNTSETLWDEYISFEQLPQIFNPKSGFIQNCNNTPYQTTLNEDENPIKENFSHTFGIEEHMTNRALRAFETFGIDNSISYEDFKNYKFDLLYSEKSYMYKYVKRSINLLDKSNFPDLNQNEINTAKLIFEKWDLSTDKDNLNAALPITTFSKIIDVDPIEITDKTIIKLLTTSITYLKKHFNNLMPKWSDVNRLIRGKENLPLSGGPDIARAIYTKRTSNGQLQATAGDCYILLINWDSNGKLFSESIHQYGSATNITDSRNYNNQCKLFANKEFKNISIDLDTIIQDSKEILVLDKSSL